MTLAFGWKKSARMAGRLWSWITRTLPAFTLGWRPGAAGRADGAEKIRQPALKGIRAQPRVGISCTKPSELPWGAAAREDRHFAREEGGSGTGNNLCKTQHRRSNESGGRRGQENSRVHQGPWWVSGRSSRVTELGTDAGWVNEVG